MRKPAQQITRPVLSKLAELHMQGAAEELFAQVQRDQLRHAIAQNDRKGQKDIFDQRAQQQTQHDQHQRAEGVGRQVAIDIRLDPLTALQGQQFRSMSIHQPVNFRLQLPLLVGRAKLLLPAQLDNLLLQFPRLFFRFDDFLRHPLLQGLAFEYNFNQRIDRADVQPPQQADAQRQQQSGHDRPPISEGAAENAAEILHAKARARRTAGSSPVGFAGRPAAWGGRGGF